MPATRPLTTYATCGAVAQHDGKLPIRTCSRCGADIVWATSARTGKRYPVTVSRNYNGARFYIGSNVHARDCGERRDAEVEEMRVLDAVAAINLAESAEIHAARVRIIGTDCTNVPAEVRDAFLAEMDAITDRFDALAREGRRAAREAATV